MRGGRFHRVSKDAPSQAGRQTRRGTGPALSIVIPAYNEAARLPATLQHALDFLRTWPAGGEVIVVDDGSTDGTASIVEDRKHGVPFARLIQNAHNRGKGYSVRRGVLEARGELILFSDADESTPIVEASRLAAALQTSAADVAVGSRYTTGAQIECPQPLSRRALGWLFRRVVRLFGVRRVSDTQCGFKMFRREAARKIFALQRIDGFAFDVEVLMLARRLGYRVVEVPIKWRESPGSTVRPIRDGLRMLADLCRAWLGAKTACRRHKGRSGKEGYTK